MLEKHDLAVDMLRVVNDLLGAKGLMLRSRTAVDAKLISAPSSTKNAEGERNPQMKQTRKGNNWYFGMKAHIGVDTQSGLVHTVVGTAANVNDLNVAGQLLHGDEEAAFGDAGYQGVHKRPEAAEPTWHVAMRPGQGRAPVPRAQAAVRVHQGALPRAGQEHRADRHAVRALQPVDGAPAVDGSRGVSAAARSAAGSRGARSACEVVPTDRKSDRIEGFGAISSSAQFKLLRASRCADLP